eukprot:TRINITY_DN51677_c0_g1_i1.p1 TRINITY_DN51677_c0_g1~~TRINITY_DN51677_c0_g1_i1.p1  ORF type:complete len:274 (-),score=66.65 TRINITY_DN51677_c0_g1_i1:165-986(-)
MTGSEGGNTTASDPAPTTAVVSFEEFAKKYLGSGAEKATEVVLDGRRLKHPFVESDQAFLASLTSLKKLSLNACKIKAFAPLEVPPTLESLELADNLLCDLQFLSKATSLTRLTLGGNPIPNLDSVKVLASLKNLTSLDLEATPVMEDCSASTWLWDCLPSLMTLNKRDKEGNDVEDDDEEDEYEDDDDDDDEDDEDEEDSAENAAVDLKKFYEGIHDDDEDEEDFQPAEDGDDDDDDVDDDEEDKEGEEGEKSKRSREDDQESEPPAKKATA